MHLFVGGTASEIDDLKNLSPKDAYRYSWASILEMWRGWQERISETEQIGQRILPFFGTVNSRGTELTSFHRKIPREWGLHRLKCRHPPPSRRHWFLVWGVGELFNGPGSPLALTFKRYHSTFLSWMVHLSFVLLSFLTVWWRLPVGLRRKEFKQIIERIKGKKRQRQKERKKETRRKK